jgi:hypothetical protein
LQPIGGTEEAAGNLLRKLKVGDAGSFEPSVEIGGLSILTVLAGTVIGARVTEVA